MLLFFLTISSIISLFVLRCLALLCLALSCFALTSLVSSFLSSFLLRFPLVSPPFFLCLFTSHPFLLVFFAYVSSPLLFLFSPSLPAAVPYFPISPTSLLPNPLLSFSDILFFSSLILCIPLPSTPPFLHSLLPSVSFLLLCFSLISFPHNTTSLFLAVGSDQSSGGGENESNNKNGGGKNTKKVQQAFTLLLRKSTNVTIPPKGIQQIGISFAPERLGEYTASVQVRSGTNYFKSFFFGSYMFQFFSLCTYHHSNHFRTLPICSCLCYVYIFISFHPTIFLFIPS